MGLYFPKQLLLRFKPRRAWRQCDAGAGMTAKRPINMVVLIDALGWHYLENRTFLNAELPFRRSLQTILGFSSGAIPTIMTGLPPAKTGHWNLFTTTPRIRLFAG